MTNLSQQFIQPPVMYGNGDTFYSKLDERPDSSGNMMHEAGVCPRCVTPLAKAKAHGCKISGCEFDSAKQRDIAESLFVWLIFGSCAILASLPFVAVGTIAYAIWLAAFSVKP